MLEALQKIRVRAAALELTDRELAVLLRQPAPEAAAAAPAMAWGPHVSADFRAKVRWLVEDLDIGPAPGAPEPDWLMAWIAWESGRTFSSKAKNMAGSGAVGLIQFMPDTARDLGTSSAEPAVLTPEKKPELRLEVLQALQGPDPIPGRRLHGDPMAGRGRQAARARSVGSPNPADDLPPKCWPGREPRRRDHQGRSRRQDLRDPRRRSAAGEPRMNPFRTLAWPASCCSPRSSSSSWSAAPPRLTAPGPAPIARPRSSPVARPPPPPRRWTSSPQPHAGTRRPTSSPRRTPMRSVLHLVLARFSILASSRAGLDGLCMRDAYRHSARCMLAPGPSRSP